MDRYYKDETLLKVRHANFEIEFIIILPSKPRF